MLLLIVVAIEKLYLVYVGQEDVLHEAVRFYEVTVGHGHFVIALRDSLL
jgi:hypothetical protein